MPMSHKQNLAAQHRQEYLAFQNAKYRCENPKNKSYPDYGQRGIKFSFSSFAEFFAEVGPRPSPEHSLDRFPNNDGNYEKGNIRWATRVEQASNKRAYPRVVSKPLMLSENPSPELTPAAILHDIPTTARIMSTTTWAIRALCRSGQLTHIKIGHRWLVSTEAIRKFIAQAEKAA